MEGESPARAGRKVCNTEPVPGEGPALLFRSFLFFFFFIAGFCIEDAIVWTVGK